MIVTLTTQEAREAVAYVNDIEVVTDELLHETFDDGNSVRILEFDDCLYRGDVI